MKYIFFEHFLPYIVAFAMLFMLITHGINKKKKWLNETSVFCFLAIVFFMYHLLYGGLNEKVKLYERIKALDERQVLHVMVLRNKKFVELDKPDSANFIKTIKFSEEGLGFSENLKEFSIVKIVLRDSVEIELEIRNTNNRGIVFSAYSKEWAIENLKNDKLASCRYLFD